jgi:hypothetical protein
MSSLGHSRHIEQILDRQAREWEMRRKLAEEGGEVAVGELAHLPEGPWISISKQLGAEAVEVAESLHGRLGWQVFDKEIIESIARETHTRERVLSRMDERAVHRFDDWLEQLLVPDQPPQMTYLQQMARVIWALAKQGRVILLGRGANWFLDNRYGLRVRAIAPLDVRVRKVAEREKISPKDAGRKVRAADASRAAFIRQVYHRDIDDPLGYDLVVNTETLGAEAAADAVLAALKTKLG